MDSTSSNRPLTVGWGYPLSPLSLRTLAQPSYFQAQTIGFATNKAPLPDFFLDNTRSIMVLFYYTWRSS